MHEKAACQDQNPVGYQSFTGSLFSRSHFPLYIGGINKRETALIEI